MNGSSIHPTSTYPESAWIAFSFPLWVTVALVLIGAVLLRGPLTRAVRASLHDRAQAIRKKTGRGDLPIDPALTFVPETIAPQQLLIVALLVVLVGIVALSLITPMLLALILAMPVTLGVIWLLARSRETHYCEQIDRLLPGAVGRLHMQMAAGDSFALAIEKLVADMPPSPLQAEWQYIVGSMQRPLSTGLLATDAEVVYALGAQTPSIRHSVFLGHLEVALAQPQDAQVKRISAAHSGLLEAEQRRSNAVTELAQMRYSGYAIGLAAIVMALYLVWTQWDRFITAYTGPLGPFAGVFVGAALIAPFVMGDVLARVADVDY